MNQDYNIILINLDGFRKDKIDLCPTLKLLKENNYFFPNMFTVAPYTFSALPAVFSGMYPSRNGANAYYNMFKFKSNEITTLAQLLKQGGYYSCCDVIDDSVVPRSGFDEYNIYDEENVNFLERHKEMIKQLSKKEKFFLFLHNTETHKHLVRDIVQQYGKNEDDSEYYKLKNENHERYNSYLPLCDNYISGIVNSLDEFGLSHNTILIFFADHGTSCGEKIGEKFYGVFTYDYTINVFCIINIPNRSSKIINQQCMTIDLFPTIAELANVPIQNESIRIQGKNLLSFVNDIETVDRDIFVETGGLYGPWPSPEKHNVFCIRNKEKKLIYNDTPQTWEFYDLKNDPNELNNIYDENLEEICIFKDKLVTHFQENNIKTHLTF
jgi:arylsulfatase A-like enzyme